MIHIINKAFPITIPLEPKHCILSMLDAVIPDMHVREAASRVLFQDLGLILLHWTYPALPTMWMWLEQMGVTLHYIKMIY